MEGWVKFHRKIEEWEWYTDPNTFRVFFHLVLKANHKPNKWKGIQIGKGQLITSRDKLSEQLNLSVQQIRTSLKKLESTDEITIKTTNRYTVVTIENYGLYQTKEEEVTTKTTNKQPTDNQQITTNKNEEKEKNVKKEYRKVQHLSLSNDDFNKLNILYSESEIDDTLDDMENWTKLKSKKSAYLTANNWLKKSYPNRKEKLENIKEIEDDLPDFAKEGFN